MNLLFTSILSSVVGLAAARGIGNGASGIAPAPPKRFSGVDWGSGAQEVEDLGSDTTAKVEWSFDVGFTKMEYKFSIFDSDFDVVEIHFHCGRAGANGKVVVNFEQVDDVYVEGEITNANIDPEACDGINNLASLYQAMRDGEIYFNLHDEDAQVRGQIFTSN